MKQSMAFSRRKLLTALGLGVVTSTLPASLHAQTLPHVVVVGGGYAGATVAKYLKLWGGHSVQVTLVEPNDRYVSPILSNLVLNGQKTIQNLTFTYAHHQQTYEVSVVSQRATGIDKYRKTLTLSDGSVLSYTKLVLAPGIDFRYTNDYDITQVPHAWQAGEQTNILKTQLDAMEDGDRFVMSIPPAPYRCPPGPYERACVVADYLKNTRGFSRCQVTVLDANPNIVVEANTFGAAFRDYGVDYQANAVVSWVDDSSKTVSYSQDGGATTKHLSAQTLNIIPPQKAGQLIFDAGLNEGLWAPIHPLTYESTKVADIHVIGDSQGTAMPKAGHIANSEAKVCADAILRVLNGLSPDPAPKTNSACYSPLSSRTASWLTAVYEYNPSTQQMQLVSGAGYPASAGASRQNYTEMFNWAGNLFEDTFG